MALLGQGFEDPRSAAIMALAGGLLKGDFGGGLLGANQAYAQAADRQTLAQDRAFKQKQLEQEIADANAKRGFLSGLPSPENASPTQQMMLQGVRAGAIPFGDYLKAIQPKELPFAKVDPKDYTPESVQAFAQAGGDYTKLQPVRKLDVVNNQAVDLYKTNPGTVFDMQDPNKPFMLRGGQAVPNTPFQQYELGKAREGAARTNVSINEGQKGLENELKLRGDFRSEPIYKAHQDVESAYSQISTAIKQDSPAGDLAAATKIMKILDPGSVVRESELGMAMAATGVLDRLTNYGDMVMRGTKLTPAQRKDFQSLADRLFQESATQYNAKRKEYTGIAEQYGLNPERVGGKPSEARKPLASPQVFNTLPPATGYRGKVMVDQETGKRYKSNGLTWVAQ